MRIVLLALCISLSAAAETYRICEFSALPEELPLEELKHTRNSIVTWFAPYHSTNDVIAVFGRDVEIGGKFSYGLAGKDLEDEVIEFWIDDCRGHYSVIHRGVTDSDGRVAWTMPTKLVKEPGEYRIWLRVVGDGTGVFLTLRVVSPRTKVAVFDIDGTLTTREDEVRLEVISELVGGNYSPPKRDYSSELSNFLHDRLGYQIVYLTGRHYYLTDLTRIWLDRNDFASGTLIIAQSIRDIMPTNHSVGRFKLTELEKLKANGLVIDRAYGNATTDIFAYTQGKISLDRIFIVGKYSGADGTVSLGDDFVAHYHKLFSGGNV